METNADPQTTCLLHTVSPVAFKTEPADRITRRPSLDVSMTMLTRLGSKRKCIESPATALEYSLSSKLCVGAIVVCLACKARLQAFDPVDIFSGT